MDPRAAASTRVEVALPRQVTPPLAVLGRRLAIAVGLIGFVAVVSWLGRSGYRDSAGGEVGLLDAIYYATVSITTTGYGDIVPVSTEARLATTLLVTPARILFLILLVGTTVEFLAEDARERLRVRRWRATLRDHTIVCGFGTKGRSAVDALVAGGASPDRIVVIDNSPAALQAARSAGMAAVTGNGEETAVLEQAGIRKARAVVVAPDRDDTAVLITLTARELNSDVTIVSAVREAENAHLLRQSGADSVITSSSAAGRLLGLATDTPRLVQVLEDLLSVGEGLDLIEREPTADELGGRGSAPGQLVIAVIRADELIRFDDPRAAELRSGDRVVCVCSQADG
ncbi:MAG: potassium channel family protein [Actinomycetota bacterium]|nr:potassium channel family protein [Actinomycetota bacterium]